MRSPPSSDFAGLALHDVLFGGALHQLARKFALVADVAVHFAALHAIERRLGDVDVLLFDQLAHVAEEESEQQRANVAAVHVRVGHENDFVVAELGGVEIVLADAGAERRDDAANFLVAEHLVVARFFDVENLALERQDGLVAAVAPALGRAAGRFALDDEQLAARGIALLAIGEFSRQAAESSADLRRVSSRALRAASRARAASMHLPMIFRAIEECLSKYSPSFSLTS